MAKTITGRKGGSSSSRTPVEQPDDLQSVAKAKILMVLGEGEFAGGLTAKDIYLDGTPLQNADGSENFSGVVWEFRPGTQAQDYIQGIPGTENEISVGTEVSSETAWTHTFTNTQLSAVRLRLKWPSLFKQQDNGDLVGYSINYVVELQTNGGSWQKVLDTNVTGKTTSGYERSHRIDLPKAGSTWTIRLRKITADANSAKIGDTMTIQSYTEVIDAKLRYPNTALLYIEFDSSQFNGSIPQIACEPRGRVIRVPDTYDPETRTYSGTWLGTFKWAWTNNPAWIFYDLVVSDRFGLGDRLTTANIDKWTLYQVAQYCDQMVPDGKGGSGTEPRYTCNVYIQERNDAYTVLRDFAAIFRGMTYWGDDKIVALADMPRDVDFTYTHANVIDGRFTYSSSTTKNRYTNALVSWSDPDNAYSDAMEPVFEQALVARYGFNQLEITAIGCTRQSEANRKGRWGILTNNKDRVVTFNVGEDGNIPQPGYVIAVADRNLSGRELGGRISAVNGRVLTLDRAPDASAADRMIVNLPSGVSQSRTIQSITGNKVTVTTAYSETPVAEAVWVIESDELYAQQYRVITVTDNNDGTFTIVGANHDPDKFDRIDTGAIIDQRPVSVIPPGNQSPPANIVISSFSVVQQNISVETMRVSWDQVQNAIAYEAQWRRNDGNWVNVPRSSTTSFDVPGIYAGRYLVRVRAINAAEISSGWGYSEEKTLTGKVGNPPKPVGFIASDNVVFGIELSWGFPANTDDTLKTEIQYSLTGTEDDAMLLADVPYPQRKYQQMGLKAGQIFWYRAQLVDRSGNESGYTDFVRGQASIDVSDITDAILEDMKGSDTFKDLIENAVDSNEKIAGMADDIKQANDELAQQAQEIAKNAQDIGKVQTSVTNLSSTVGDVSSSLSELEQTVATADTALGQRIDNISVSVDGMTGGVKNSAIAIIQGNLAQVAARKTLSASVAGNSAQLDRIDEVIVNEKEATARSLLSLQTDVNGNKASINSLNQTFSDYHQATATQINGITATVNGHTSAITTNAQAIANVNGDLKAMYNIKVGVASNGQYYAAGMGIGVENTPYGMQSQVIFLADRFAVTHQAGATVTLPFVIQNGQVIIRDTVIGDATITRAKLAETISSVNYVQNQAGLSINFRTGTLENYGSTAGEGAMKQTNQTISVKDANNVLRVQIGRITGTW
ncbi:host specificity protein J [Enterobacter hormaechei]|uniref:host specificity protein J n=1 Tax=Enterobacter hormaechei TaxID=158836 RepID=UPI000BB8FBB9|nr:phage tail protein [Enterobacter hormaechei]DAL34735.1 MAG TPA_asm: tail protein [Caudoviricetes sp.]HCJ7631142.1 phage tail protein [Enterobacter hormaechei subsp. xiangfangensis]HED1500535.1 phage tail protein [Enterobacter hormaechei subsp. hoffmannii]MCM6991008.1 phage tail protein [Enterobacter hormaechei]MDS1986446.1 phage tail protein [Enterobacter hormaechei]